MKQNQKLERIPYTTNDRWLKRRAVIEILEPQDEINASDGQNAGYKLSTFSCINTPLMEIPQQLIQRAKKQGSNKTASKSVQSEQTYIKDVDGIYQYVAQANDNGQKTMLIGGINAAPDAKTAFWEHLTNCAVQIASSNRSNAFHKNSKKGIPNAPSFSDDHELLKPTDTALVEFCVTGQKKKCGIERAVFHRQSGAVYITKHYDGGQFVHLTDAPDALVNSWKAKANEYALWF